jgi:hypothetical protein
MKLNDIEYTIHKKLEELCEGSIQLNFTKGVARTYFIYPFNPISLACELRNGIEEDLLRDIIDPEDDLRDD